MDPLDLLYYVGYRGDLSNDLIKNLVLDMSPGQSIQPLMQKYLGTERKSYPIDTFFVGEYQSVGSLLKQLSVIKPEKLKTIIIEPHAPLINKQMLEYLCSGGHIEHITIPFPMDLPYPHLSKLKTYNGKPVPAMVLNAYLSLSPRLRAEYLIDYAGYQNINPSQMNAIVKLVTPGKSVGYAVENILSKSISIVGLSNLSDIKPNQVIYGLSYESMGNFFKRFRDIDLKHIRSINILEESFQLNNQIMEYLCSTGNIEEIKIPEERHSLSRLPVYHLKKLRNLFLCEDRNVSINDDDLCITNQLQLLGLSHNNEITNRGISCLHKLITAGLYGNRLINTFLLSKKSNPELEYIITYDVDEPESPVCHWTFTKI
jgi:hypothetical protein